MHHPEHLTCGDVVEEQSRTANVLSDSAGVAIVCGPAAGCGHAVGRVDEVVLVAQRDEDGETAGLVLQLAKSQHVVDAVTRLLDVAVQHRGRGLEALAVGEPVDARPVLPVRVVVDDVLADLPVEDLRAAAGERLEAGVDQLVEDLVGGQPADLLEPVDLGRGERLQRTSAAPPSARGATPGNTATATWGAGH